MVSQILRIFSQELSWNSGFSALADAMRTAFRTISHWVYSVATQRQYCPGEYMTQQRVLSGIRATGRLHLGNYLGAVKGMLALQADPTYQTLYMVADAHTLTTPYNVEELKKNRREVIIDYLAAGLDPNKSILFQQAEIAEHFELAFYFASVTTIAKMQHLPTFKEKVKQYPEHATISSIIRF